MSTVEDYVSGQKSDYTQGSLKRMIRNWPEIEAAVTEPVILYRWDMEEAIERLSEEERKTIFTVIAFGDSAFSSDAVTETLWSAAIRRMHSILNVEGLVRKNNPAEARLATDKGRPFSPLELYRKELGIV